MATCIPASNWSTWFLPGRKSLCPGGEENPRDLWLANDLVPQWQVGGGLTLSLVVKNDLHIRARHRMDTTTSLQSLLSKKQTKLLSLIVAWSSSHFISCFKVQSSIGHLRELNCEKVYNVENPFDFMKNISDYILTKFWLKFWMHSNYILATSWLHSDYIKATFWLNSDYIPTTFWLHSYYILATFWVHSISSRTLIYCSRWSLI